MTLVCKAPVPPLPPFQRAVPPYYTPVMASLLPSLDELFEQFYTAKPLQASHLNHQEKFHITQS